MGITLTISENGLETKAINHHNAVQRVNKGSSIDHYVKDYCVIDLETTGILINYAKIVEISAIRVRNTQIVSEYSTLVNPQTHIPEEATLINHITDEMVKDAPTLDEIIDDFLDFVGNDVIVGYNIARFDTNIIYDNVMSLRNRPFENNYLDVYFAVRRSLSDLNDYRLETVCQHYGICSEISHRALRDCYDTKECYEAINNDFGDIAFKKKSDPSYSRQSISRETRAIQTLQNMLTRLLDRNELTNDDAYSLQYWLEEHDDLSGKYPFDSVCKALNNVLDDGNITDEESYSLTKLFSEVLDPVKHQEPIDISTIFEKHICLTGDFAYGSKAEVESLIKENGGIIDKNVTKSTNFIVVGANGSSSWKAGNYGSKIQHAMEMKEKGLKIDIIEESAFIKRIQKLFEEHEKGNAIMWKKDVQATIDKFILSEELPEKSIRLVENTSRDGKSITSYSICINEPEYPLTTESKKDCLKSDIILNIKESQDSIEILIQKEKALQIDVPSTAFIKNIESDKTNAHIFFPYDSSELNQFIEKCLKDSYTKYVSKSTQFGCCNLYEQCSDQKKCIHENKLYSKACIYRKQLENGIIYYGKNRNIDKTPSEKQ